MSCGSTCNCGLPVPPVKPPVSDCCVTQQKRCAAGTFFVPFPNPPWFTEPPKCRRFHKPIKNKTKFSFDMNYDHLQEYMDPRYESAVLPAVAFYHYADTIPNLDGTTNKPSSEKVIRPWLKEEECPPPKECEPCGPGPWANPQIRRFFYVDCL